jgi:Polymer-forming cytoskeletal
VEVNGQIEGDVRCTSLVISSNAQVVGSVIAERVVVNGRVEGPFKAATLCLSPRRMWSVIFDISLSRLRRAPTSRAAQHKLRPVTEANRKKPG